MFKICIYYILYEIEFLELYILDVIFLKCSFRGGSKVKKLEIVGKVSHMAQSVYGISRAEVRLHSLHQTCNF